MANVKPRMGFSGYPVGWLLGVTIVEGDIDSISAAYNMNQLQGLNYTLAVSAAAAAATANKISEAAIDGVTFQINEVSELRNLVTGDEESSGSGGGGGGSSDKASCTSLSVHHGDDIDTLQSLMDGGTVLFIAPLHKNYKDGSVATITYFGLLGTLSADIPIDIQPNSIVKIPIEVTGGQTYTDTGGAIATALAGLAAIKPAGSDDAGAGIAAPTAISDSARLLTGKLTKLT